MVGRTRAPPPAAERRARRACPRSRPGLAARARAPSRRHAHPRSIPRAGPPSRARARPAGTQTHPKVSSSCRGQVSMPSPRMPVAAAALRSRRPAFQSAWSSRDPPQHGQHRAHVRRHREHPALVDARLLTRRARGAQGGLDYCTRRCARTRELRRLRGRAPPAPSTFSARSDPELPRGAFVPGDCWCSGASRRPGPPRCSSAIPTAYGHPHHRAVRSLNLSKP